MKIGYLVAEKLQKKKNCFKAVQRKVTQALISLRF